MPNQLAKHAHLLMEENPDGTVNVYQCAPVARGVSRAQAGAMLQQAQAMGMIGGVVPPMPVASAPVYSGLPSRFGMSPPVPTGAVPDPFSTVYHTEADSDWEKDASKFRPSSGAVIWAGGFNIRSTDPRIWLVLVPKKRGNPHPELAAHGYDAVKARAVARSLMKGADAKLVSPDAIRAGERYPKSLAQFIDSYNIFRVTTTSKIAEESRTPAAINAGMVEVGERGVRVVLADPSATRARKVLTPAVSLASMLNNGVLSDHAQRALK